MSDYSKHDHTHCFDTPNPPCGQKIKHFECCLCQLPHPNMRDTSREENWEKEWNRRFFPANKNRPGFYAWSNPDPQDIEDFIHSVASQAREKGIREALAVLPEENDLTKDVSKRMADLLHYAKKSGSNSAIIQSKENINKLLK